MFTSILQALISMILCPGGWKFTGLLFSIPHTKTSQISYYFLLFLHRNRYANHRNTLPPALPSNYCCANLCGGSFGFSTIHLVVFVLFSNTMHLGLIWVDIVIHRCYFNLTTAILFCYEFSIHKWNKWHCFRFHPIEVDQNWVPNKLQS